MMFTVIVVFVLCWTPLYGLYCYFFLSDDKDSSFFQFASSVLRPIFQALFYLLHNSNEICSDFTKTLIIFQPTIGGKIRRGTFIRGNCLSNSPSLFKILKIARTRHRYEYEFWHELPNTALLSWMGIRTFSDFRTFPNPAHFCSIPISNDFIIMMLSLT
ncbi:unnamed protein product [Meloidogyne enterolobii]|uniref:Uncharacterized protein n=1 Tax=Meloidogyne enterolobii TaxID=390850 RepID=A0ACB0YWM9_MELEN